MSQTTPLKKDYSRDFEAFAEGLKARSISDLVSYQRNLISSLGRITGDDAYAQDIFVTLSTRARLIKEELDRRPSIPIPPQLRKRRIDELTDHLNNYEAATQGKAKGARYDDPPIPTKVTPHAPAPPKMGIRPLIPVPGGSVKGKEKMPEPESPPSMLICDEESQFEFNEQGE